MESDATREVDLQLIRLDACVVGQASGHLDAMSAWREASRARLLAAITISARILGCTGLRPYKNVLDYSLAGGHLCVVQADHTVACRMANGKRTSNSAAPADKHIVDVDTFNESWTCGVTTQGELWCWTDKSTE